jgi:haloalkane dehalogenase
MHYVDEGRGEPVIMLHGNPTWSFYFRKLIQGLSGRYRAVAPDHIGCGLSDKPRSCAYAYRLKNRVDDLETLLAHLGLARDITLVLHDWGSVLGFDWARRHPSAVKGIAYMEAIVRVPRLADMAAPVRLAFQSLRSPAGEQMILQDNLFIEQMLPGAVMRQLTDAEMAEYRRPYLEPGESRRPMLTWPREVPFDGEPADVAAIVEANGRWLGTSAVPKLFIDAEPGLLMALPGWRELCRSFPNQREVTVAGLHFIQEDSPEAIGVAIADWLRRL